MSRSWVGVIACAESGDLLICTSKLTSWSASWPVGSPACWSVYWRFTLFFFFQAEDGIRDHCVTGVQTCALPICGRRLALGLTELVDQVAEPAQLAAGGALHLGAGHDRQQVVGLQLPAGRCGHHPAPAQYHHPVGQRSEERRVGKEWRSRWSPYHY